MKAKGFVTSLLIAVLSGCEVPEPAAPFTAPMDETGGPPELFYRPPQMRKIAQPGVKITFSTEFVAIELAAGSTMPIMPSPTCPRDVGALMTCVVNSDCESRPDPSELVDLDKRAHRNDRWTMGTVGDQPVYAANDGAGTLIVADGTVELSRFTSWVTSGDSGAIPWPCGGAPCAPDQCPTGSPPVPRAILLDIDQAVKDNPACDDCELVCDHPPPGSCPCAQACHCPC